MGMVIDLKRYCSEATLAEGTRFQAECKVAVVKEERDNGLSSFRVKTYDKFNFVNQVSLEINTRKESIQSFECNCRNFRNLHAFCKHCVASAITVLELVETEAVPTVEEEPVMEPAEEVAAVPDFWGFGAGQDITEEPETSFDEVDENPESTEVPETEAAVEEPTEAEEVEDGDKFEDISAILSLLELDSEEDRESSDVLTDTVSEPEADDSEAADSENEEPVYTGPASMEILFGHDLETGEEIIWRPNDTEQVFHTNTGIIGTMGTGKTQFTKSLITQIYREQSRNYDGTPMGILIFDYKGDYNESKEDFVDAVGARILKPYRLPFNPFSLKKGRSFLPLLPLHTANTFKDTVSKIYNLGPKQQANLLDCIFEAYRKQGIYPENPSTWDRPAPTIDQVYKIYIEQFGSKTPDSLTAAMNKLYQFCIFENDPRKAKTLTDILRGVVVIDLSGYEEDIQNLIVAITLDQFYSQMQIEGSSKTDGKYRQQKYLILVDEADNFMSKGFPSLRKIMKEGREFGVGMVLSTQSLTHFAGEDNYSRYVLTWVVHNVSDLAQRDVEYIFKLKPKSQEILEVYSTIKGLEKHQSVVKIANNEPEVMKDRAFWQLLS